ncbi:F-box protein At2g02240-like [Cornus florida]|uniref:F-box protein At2g02240-like n=1 Tax=Cornus florida TaxID=4283 RepID=UPI0028A20F65|nr:F-box protein At2g02240-like [Cornus florida]
MANFFLLPEDLIAKVLSLTSPPDVGRLTLVASTVRSVADSDAVWETLLQKHYHGVVSQAQLILSSKKQLYFKLCPLLISGGKKSFWLDKWSGKKCYMLAARDLSIIWGDTPRFWKWDFLQESRFTEVAELVNVCWLEIRGKIDTRMLSPDTTYAAHLVFKLTPEMYGFEHRPVEGWVGVGGRGGETRTVYLDPLGENSDQYPKEREDGWFEIELGEFFNRSGEDGKLEVCLQELKSGMWKGGLIVEGIEIRPKENN